MQIRYLECLFKKEVNHFSSCFFFFFSSDGLQLSWICCRFSKFSCITQHLFRTQVVAYLEILLLPVLDLAKL